MNLHHDLTITFRHTPQPADILIVVHNQLGYLRACLESVAKYTNEPHRIYLWDNGSDAATRDFIRTSGVHFAARSARNHGFIRPNNYLAGQGRNPFLVLLNSDTVIRSPLWLRSLTSALLDDPTKGVVGYRGGNLDREGVGCDYGNGYRDYVEGWALCLSRTTYRQFGLFDESNLHFAYGEDADLCLRLREHGLSSYALHTDAVYHHGNRTAQAVPHATNWHARNAAYLAKRFKATP